MFCTLGVDPVAHRDGASDHAHGDGFAGVQTRDERAKGPSGSLAQEKCATFEAGRADPGIMLHTGCATDTERY